MSNPSALTTDTSRSEGEYFNSLIDSAGDFNPFEERGWQALTTRFDEMIAPAGPIDLLDVGCGTGRSLQIYEKHCRSYTGVDLSSSAIDFARKRFPQQSWLVADAGKLPMPDDTYDVVAFSSVIHHIPDPMPALREAVRVLKPGGKVFAFDPNLLNPAMALFRWPRCPLYTSVGVSPNERPLLPRELRNWFKQAGLADIRQRCQADLPYRAVAPKVLNAMVSFFNVGNWVMEKTLIGRLLGVFVITTARKPG